MIVALMVVMVVIVGMVSVITVIAVSAMIMSVAAAHEPENGYDKSAYEDHNHLEPLFVSLVELIDNNLAAGHVDESTA